MAQINGCHKPDGFGKPVKITVEGKSFLDILINALGEGGIYEEFQVYNDAGSEDGDSGDAA